MRKNNMHVYSNNMHSQSQHTTSIKRSGSTDHLGDLGHRSLRSLGVLGVGRTPFPLGMAYFQGVFRMVPWYPKYP